MTIYTHDVLVETNDGSSWTAVPAANLLEVAGDTSITGGPNALAFGDDSDLSFQVHVRASQFAAAPARLPIRVSPTINGTTATSFLWGQVVGANRSYSEQVWSLSCAGIKAILQTAKVHTQALARRPAATKTTATSVENPSNPACRTGILNQAAWLAGGRPLEQAVGYPAATFYYSFDQALFAPLWSWLAGDDAWSAMLNVVRAVGGQLYQDGAVLRFRQPLAVADLGSVASFSDSDFQDVEEETESFEQVAGKVSCIYIPQVRRIRQEVISDDTPHLVEPGAAKELPAFEPGHPLLNVQAPTFTATYLNGAAVPTGGSGLTYTAEVSAQRIVLTVTNNGTIPFVIHRIQIQAEPIAPGTQGTASYGSGTERALEGLSDIQDDVHARQIAQLWQHFVSVPRPVRTLSGCVWRPGVQIGQAVSVSLPLWSVSNELHLVVGISLSEATRLADYRMVSLTGLPRLSQMFTASASAQHTTKKLGI